MLPSCRIWTCTLTSPTTLAILANGEYTGGDHLVRTTPVVGGSTEAEGWAEILSVAKHMTARAKRRVTPFEKQHLITEQYRADHSPTGCYSARRRSVTLSRRRITLDLAPSTSTSAALPRVL